MTTSDLVEEAYSRARQQQSILYVGFDQLDQLLRQGSPLPKVWREAGAQLVAYVYSMPIERWRHEEETELTSLRRYMRNKMISELVRLEHAPVAPLEEEIKFFATPMALTKPEDFLSPEDPPGWREVPEAHADEVRIKLSTLARPF